MAGDAHCWPILPDKLSLLRQSDAVILGLLLGFAAIVGDLAESLLKRSCGAKDSGRFLPGIGGALDLIDSILFTAPMMFFYLRFVAEPMKKRRVVILGSTGCIGESALKVARDIPERMEIVGLAAREKCRAFAGAGAGICAAGRLHRRRSRAEESRRSGMPGFRRRRRTCELATLPEADLVLIAIVGTAGLRPALAAIEAGKDIAVASKEILVMAGEAVMNAARRKGVQVLPVDSEHNAIFQCLEGRQPRAGPPAHPHRERRPIPHLAGGGLAERHASRRR